MDKQRQAYHKALAIPLSNIESLWKEYDAFENGLNKLTAKKLLGEKSAAYMTARTAYREMKNLMSLIDTSQKNWVAVPPLWTDRDYAMLDCWKKYISWEKSNPLHIEDKGAIASRVMYAFKSCLLMMRYFPEIWYDTACYLVEIGKVDDAVNILKQGIEVLPRSLLLTFTLAEITESRKKETTATTTATDLTTIFQTLITNIEKQIDEINVKYDEKKESMLVLLRGEGSGEDKEKEMSEWDGERREREREKMKEMNVEVEGKVESMRKEELKVAKRAWSLSWIVYMRVVRRSQNIKAARNLFKTARKSPYCTYHVYISAALMEYFCSKDTAVACKVFEAGMKAFADDESLADFILHYLKFLISLNEENNSRALFERALVALKSDQCRDIWNVFLDHEINYGELGNVLKADKRRMEAYSEDIGTKYELKAIADRWSYLDINHVGDRELGINYPNPDKSRQSNQRQSNNINGGGSSSNFGSSSNGFDLNIGGGLSIPSGQELTGGTSAGSGSGTGSNTNTSGKARHQNLDSVHPERYPRPDFSKWVSYKPEPPVVAKTGLGGSPAIAGASQSAAVPVTVVTHIPDAIAKFLEILPTANSYNGPPVPVDEILDILRHLPIPLPVNPPVMVPIPPGVSLGAKNEGKSRDGGGFSGSGRSGEGRSWESTGGSRDRGGFSGRGGRGSRGGRGGFKRRGGYGSDDDERLGGRAAKRNRDADYE
ncbi:mRNA 3'-end-processing protein rna14 [Blyttiomyces sp. JEL0837]|nr:mRNA 3'-end-processing protein rna14 [Blyttiomyces sp. JEL0837]